MSTPDDNYDLQRQIDKLEAKVDKLDFKVQTGFEGVGELLGERLKGLEQRLEMTSKQQQQAIELLISAQSSNETQVQMVDRDLTKLKAEHSALSEKFEALRDNVKWTVRALVTTTAATVASLIVALIK